MSVSASRCAWRSLSRCNSRKIPVGHCVGVITLTSEYLTEDVERLKSSASPSSCVPLEYWQLRPSKSDGRDDHVKVKKASRITH